MQKQQNWKLGKLKTKKTKNLGVAHNNKTNGSFGVACIIKKLEALELHA
jgi:hypothetical protein